MKQYSKRSKHKQVLAPFQWNMENDQYHYKKENQKTVKLIYKFVKLSKKVGK